MGLLEDAIREHLELKRLRGADPAEVAREQREVLDAPVRDDASASAPTSTDGEGAPAADASDPAGTPGDAEGAEESLGGAAPAEGEISHVGQETAELDMESVLEDTPQTGGEDAVPGDAHAEGGASGAAAGTSEEDSLEWEVPPRSSQDEEAKSEQQIPGQGRLSF